MNLTKYILILTLSFAAFCLLIGIYVYSILSEGLPSLEQLENPRQNLATQVLSSDGKLLDHFYIERRVNLPLDSIPKDFINALIATEDKNFYKHWGVHVERIVKAAVKNLLARRGQEGASTITMQLARNMFLNNEHSLSRKIREAFTAIEIEKTYTKEEILEMYSNTVAFGRGAYGIQVASKIYFDKSPRELTTAECAFLVAVLKAPEHYNGIVDKEKSLMRRNLVLGLMNEQGYLSYDKFITALEEPINLKAGKTTQKYSLLAPHFVEMIRQRFVKEDNSLRNYDLYRDGLTIYTTLDSRLQKYANEAVEEHMLEFQKLINQRWDWKSNSKLLDEFIRKAIRDRADYQAASDDKKRVIERKLRSDKNFIDSVKNIATTIQNGLVVINPRDGAILAMVGASPKFMYEHPDAKYSLNHVTQIRRQPGSSFKPFVYSLAIENGMTPATMIECGPYTYKIPETGEVWSPSGGGCDPGEMLSLYDALRKSINSVAARLITQVVTPYEVVSLCNRLGFTSNLRAVPALALGGGGEVSPLEMASAYCAFAYNGYHVNPYYITRIEDRFGNVIYEQKKSRQVTDALKKETTYTMTKMMQAVIAAGTGWRVRQYLNGCQAAGKTGTTNDFADAWFVGYTPELVAGVWVGFDDQRIKFGGDYGQGGRAAAPIWGRLMGKIYKDKELPYKQTVFQFLANDQGDSLYQQTYINYPAEDRVDYESPQTKPKTETENPATKPEDKSNIHFPKLPKTNTR